MNKQQFFLYSGMIVAAALSRILPHPPNFTPITAMALFAGASLTDRRFACGVPLIAMFISDIALEMLTGWGFHSGMWVVYGTLLLLAFIGMKIKRNSVSSIAAWTLLSSVLFFITTNFAVWATSGMYTLSLQGLADCYTAAIPFFQNSIAGDVLYATVLFGCAVLAESFIPTLRKSAANTGIRA